MNNPVKVALIGAGCRGTIYAEYAKHNREKMELVAVAEPREYYLKKIAAEYSIPEANVVDDWRKLANRPKLADAVIIATQDHQHRDPALAFIEKGYDILLEKPMAPTAKECIEIADAATRKGIILAVCHVVRYTQATKMIKEMIESGKLGEVKGIQHLEPIGYWHYAHSFVRGNWSNEAASNFILLTKSCHDLDWLRYIAGAKCIKVSSFGKQTYFNMTNKPNGAASRCVDCRIERDCPYSAKKIYLENAVKGNFSWPVNVITKELTFDGVDAAIKKGPYGRCVFQCDNDVVDYQVVNMEFENGIYADFTMTAFSQFKQRQTRIFGTRGELYTDGDTVEVYDFLEDCKASHTVPVRDHSVLSGHGGGDYDIMKNFISAVSERDSSLILSGPNESMETHLSVFAAEQSRKTGQIIQL